MRIANTMAKKKILVVEDEEKMCRLLEINLQDKYQVLSATDGEQAAKILRGEDVDLVLTDLKMPKKNGIELLKEAKSRNPHLPVILITAYGTVETAVEAMKQGAYDYILKPLRIEELELTIQKALAYKDLLVENRILRRELKRDFGEESIITADPKMRRILELVDQIADTDATVLIQGESGTGKELVARAIHFKSPRADNPLISMNCGAIPATLLESELFGYEKGAFTGAAKTKKGRLELADSGTLFLDEVGEMPRELQVTLLRAIEEHKIMRVGGTREIEIDIRVVASTNKDLRQAVKSGNFREDLYYRLSVVCINLPPLRERKGDIPLLVKHFINKHRAVSKAKVTDVSEEALGYLKQYHWPGNIRELENCMIHAMAVAQDQVIGPGDLPEQVKEPHLDTVFQIPHSWKQLLQAKKIVREQAVGKVEREFLIRALERNRGNISRSASDVGMNRWQFQSLLKKYGIRPNEYRT